MPTATYVPLATITLSSNTADVDFTNLPSSYTDFVVLVDGETTGSGRPIVRFNDDTTTNKHITRGVGDDNTSYYVGTNNSAKIDPINGYSITGKFSMVVHFFDVMDTDKAKTVLFRVNQHDGLHVHMAAGRFNGTSATTSILFSLTANQYLAGTKFSMFGIEA